VAMARKLRREINGIARDSGLQAALDRLNGFFAEFLDGPVREAYIAANESARKSCDLVLDGLRPLDDLAQEIVRRVSALRLGQHVSVRSDTRGLGSHRPGKGT